MSPATKPTTTTLESLAAEVRPVVERDLGRRLDASVLRARRQSADAEAVVDALRSLALRGGKRIRAVLVCAGSAAFGGDWHAAVPAASGVEILHAYLLAHDDWMDGDETRRGGPAVHAALRDRFGSEREGAIGAVLAGDLGAGMALEAVSAVELAPERVLGAVRELAAAHQDVVLGQIVDVRRGVSDRAGVEAMHSLKTGSYTVRGPLRIGARLAGVSKADLEAIDAFAMPLGVAFQHQDDLLGVFGDPSVTGKPRGRDLREGKRTALVLEGLGDRAAAPLLQRVLGVEDAPDSEVEALIGKLAVLRPSVEKRIDELLGQARDAAALFGEPARALLLGAVDALAGRVT
jgi:geranylgeranyl diphosphate synthase type I